MIYAKYAAAVVMGIAITGMHYTAMAAAQFAPDTVCLTGRWWTTPGWRAPSRWSRS